MKDEKAPKIRWWALPLAFWFFFCAIYDFKIFTEISWWYNILGVVFLLLMGWQMKLFQDSLKDLAMYVAAKQSAKTQQKHLDRG